MKSLSRLDVVKRMRSSMRARIGGLRVTVYQALAQEYVYQMPAEEEEEDAD